MKKREPALEKALFGLHAEVCKIMANPKRLEIINALRKGERTVNDLADELGYTKANISQHLALFRDKGLVFTRRDGVRVFYCLVSPKILEASDLMRQVLLEQVQRRSALIDKR
jgi:ArsR family transcriptional regulator